MNYQDMQKGKKLIKNHPTYDGETSDAYKVGKKKYIYFGCEARGSQNEYHFRLQYDQKQVGQAKTLEALQRFLDKCY